MSAIAAGNVSRAVQPAHFGGLRAARFELRDQVAVGSGGI
jgi:hypothetical protein